MGLRNYLAAGLIVCLAGCSSVTEEEPIVYNYPKHQLPAEDRYGDTAWVQPPTVVPSNSDQSGFSEFNDAPLLKPADTPRGASPKLPAAASSRSRRY